MKTKKSLLAQYNRYESRNAHNLAAALLVNNFGTEEEQEEMNQIIFRTNELGSISSADCDLRFQISQKYYKNIL